MKIKNIVSEGYSLGKVLSLPELLDQIKHILDAKHPGIGWRMTMPAENTFLFSARNDYDVWSMLVVEPGGDDWVAVGHGMVDPDGKPIIFDRQQLPLTLASASEIADEAIQTYHDIDLSDYADDEDYNKGVAEGSLNEFTPGNSGDDDDYDDNDDRSMEATFTIFSKGKAHTGTVIIFPGVTTDVEYHLNGKIYIKNDMDNVYDYDDFITDAANYIQEIIQLEGDGHHFVEQQGVTEGSGDGYYYLQGGIERSKKFASEAEAMAHSKQFFQLARVSRVTLKYKEPGQPAVVVKEFTFKDSPPPKSQMSWGDFYLQNKKQGVAEAFDLHAKSTSNTNSSPELRGVYLPGAMKHPDWKEPAWSFQEIAQKLGVSTKELNGLVALYPGFPTKAPGIKSKYGSGAYYPRSEVKRWVNATDIRNILKSKKGVEEGKGLNEFAPGGNSSSSYYAVTANFVSEFSQQKEEEIQDLIAAGWTKQDLEQAGTLQGQAADIAHFEQVRDGFLKGLKPGFDAYLQGDTQMKDQLGEYWLDNDLPLNQDWEKIYGEPWGEDMDESVSNRALSEFSIGGDDDGEPKDDPYKYPKPEHYRRSIDFFGKFEANHFDKEDMDDATGVFKGYWYYGNKPKQIAYFKFDNPRRTGSNDPGMGWYYEPQDEDLDEGKAKKAERPEADYGDDYQAMVSRVKKLAGMGPLKTVYDPKKRVYKNVPTATQPGDKK